jgi:nitroimidazol reductase NimA-like FMN-containing flavoprotein (pyridoxamine 5'-phosphate oxidase superfamily)
VNGPASARTKVRRHPERAEYKRHTIDAILDEGLVCPLGFMAEVVPTMYARYARAGDLICIHGSPASQMLRNSSAGREIQITGTLLDGLVLARFAVNELRPQFVQSSMNHRWVMLAGVPTEVTAPVRRWPPSRPRWIM